MQAEAGPVRHTLAQEPGGFPQAVSTSNFRVGFLKSKSLTWSLDFLFFYKPGMLAKNSEFLMKRVPVLITI